MIALVRGELLKIRTTRSFWWTVMLGYALVILFTVIGLHTGVHSAGDVRDNLSNPGIVGILMIILGVVGAAGEYRHGTITSSLLSVPDRGRFLASKGIAYLLYGALVTLVALALVLALMIPWLDADGTSISGLGVGGAEMASIIFGGVAYAAIGAVFGVAIGGLLRNQVAAIVGVLLLFLFIDPLVGGLVDTYAKYSLSGIGTSLDATKGGADNYVPFARGIAAALFAVYVTVLLAACAFLDSRRDVSS